MMKTFPTSVMFLLVLLQVSFLAAQPPESGDDIEIKRWEANQPQPEAGLPNDRCITAQSIEVGERLYNLSNQSATLGPESEVPLPQPYTCIKSFENDMWFKFVTVPEYDKYEIIISINDCNSPAGLQALLISTESCESSDFTYHGCANHESLDTIKLFVTDYNPAKEYLIYVDGFDGTVCDYNLYIKPVGNKSLSRRDYEFLISDYDLRTEPQFELGNLDYRFENNTFSMKWGATDEEDLDFFVVEKFEYIPQLNRFRSFANVMAIIEPINSVEGSDNTYEYTDFSTVFRNTQYCYRILRVDNDGKKSFSDQVCFEANIVEEFYVDDVKKGVEPGIYTVKYINHKNKQTYDCQVMDEDRKELKAMQLAKEPARDGTITLKMSEYPPGIYYFKMGNGKSHFIRRFYVD